MDSENAKVFEVRQYVSDDGATVMAKVPIDGSDIEYIGNAIGGVAGPDGQQMQVPFAFPLEASSIEEAFEKFADAAAEAWPEFARKMQKNARKQASRIKIARATDRVVARQGGGNGQGLRI